jgi:hypothetical protein
MKKLVYVLVCVFVVGILSVLVPEAVPEPAPVLVVAPTEVLPSAPVPVSVPAAPLPTPVRVPVVPPAPVPVRAVPEAETAAESAPTLPAPSTVPEAPTATSVSEEPVLLLPGSITFVVSTPVVSVKSGTLTATPGTRITLYWDVPNAANSCTNSWGYPFISANSNNERGTDVFPDTTTRYSLSCVNSLNELLDTVSVTVEVAPSLGAGIGTLPISSMWELFTALFVRR